MTDDNLAWLPATELAEQSRTGNIDPVETAEAVISRVEKYNPALRALVHFDAEQTLKEAKALRDRSDRGPLYGVPFTVKDFTEVTGTPMTDGGFRSMQDFRSDHDTVLVQRMRAAGAFYLGKTNSPQLGYAGVTRNPMWGQTENPWKRGYNPGGSSGGAASAVAAGLGQLAEGSDGAGSVRIPAAMCGVVGIKPSLGVIPHTMIPSRHETYLYHGPITRTVADNALMLDIVSGQSPVDPLSAPLGETHYLDAVNAGAAGLKIAWSPDLGFADVDDEVQSIAREALYTLVDAGASVQEADPGWSNPMQAMFDGVWLPAFAGLEQMIEAEHEQFEVDPELLMLMEEYKKLTFERYGVAKGLRGQVWDLFSAFMSRFDILASPTLTVAGFPHTQFAPESLLGKPFIEQLLGWLLTYPSNMMTNPAITIPAGFTSEGLPVGLQLQAMPFREQTIYAAAGAIEKLRPWAGTRPNLD